MPDDLDVVFAIRSYRRAETLATKTIPLLRRLGVRPSAIHVFLSDPGELGDYLVALRDAGQSSLDNPLGIQFVPGRPGCGENGNRIQTFFPLGTRVVAIDDDLRDLLIKRNDKLLESIAPWEFTEALLDAFTLAGAGLWGVHPVPNPFFQRFKVSTDLRYICGGFYGYTVRDDPALLVTLEDKEDFERSIRWYLADGAVTRLNWISMRTVGYSGKGGMQEDRTAERVEASARALAERYPDLATLNLKKRSGHAEVRLRDRRPQPSTLA